MRRIAAITVLLAVAGCGGTRHESLPTICIQGPGVVMKALAAAPGHVAMGGTRISRCFNRDATGDQVQIVGTNLLTAAQELGDRARGGNAKAAVELGYLVGAAGRGSKRNGLGDEIVRRLQGETGGFDKLRQDYERGLRAGSAEG